MKNDFKRNQFYIKINNKNIKTYYILIENKWIQISKEIYTIYQSDYKNTYRHQQRDHGKIIYYENIENMSLTIYQKKEKDIVNDLYMEDLITKLYQILELLEYEERELIYMIYFCDLSERVVAKQLGVSKTAIHYRKNVILKKLRSLLDHSLN